MTKVALTLSGFMAGDTCNGLEDASGTPTVKPKWMYWDGKILRADDGKYHMFADRWPHESGPGDWVNSETVHPVSTALLGPYADQGYAFNNGPDSKAPHKGHNVTASELPDGTYCLIVDEIVSFTIFTASSLDGPWTNRGHAQIDSNGVPINFPQPGDQHLESNINFVVRPDGNYEWQGCLRGGFGWRGRRFRRRHLVRYSAPSCSEIHRNRIALQ